MGRRRVHARFCSNPKDRGVRSRIIPAFHSMEAWPSCPVTLPWGSVKVRAKSNEHLNPLTSEGSTTLSQANHCIAAELYRDSIQPPRDIFTFGKYCQTWRIFLDFRWALFTEAVRGERNHWHDPAIILAGFLAAVGRLWTIIAGLLPS